MNIKDLDPNKIESSNPNQPLNIQSISPSAIKEGDPNYKPVGNIPKQDVSSYLPEELLKQGEGLVKGALTSMAGTAAHTLTSGGLGGMVSPLIPEKVNTPLGDISLKYSKKPLTMIKQAGEDILNVVGGETVAKPALAPVVGQLEKRAEEGLAKEALNAVKQEAKYMTKGEKELAKKTSQGIFKAGEPAVTSEDNRLATKFKDYLGKGTNIEKENAMKDYLSKTGQETEAYLTKNNFTFTNKDLKTVLSTALNKVFPEGVKDATKKEVIDTLMSKVDKNTMLDLWKGRIRFDKAIDNVFGSEQMASGDIKKAARDAVNQFIESETTKKGAPSEFLGKLKDMSDAFRVLDRVSPKAGKELGTSKFQALIKEHPFIKDAIKQIIKTGSGVGLGLFGYDEIKKLLGSE